MHSLNSQRSLVFIPTYNEKDNIKWLLAGIQSLNLPLDILFVDDNSPDGTGAILDELAKTHSELKVVHQSGKAGIGKAHKVGIQWAYEKGYSTLVTMDADLTHSPQDIPRLLEHSGAYSVVLGSRYLQKNSLEGWNLIRKTLTRIGNFLTSNFLGIKQDATGAFRVYRLDVIPRELFQSVESNSYSFFFESLFWLHSNRFEIKEIPIALPPRTYGSSKMRLTDIYISIKTLVVLFLKSKMSRKKFAPLKKIGTSS